MRLLTLPLLVSCCFANHAFAAEVPGEVDFTLNRTLLNTSVQRALYKDAITWKVGDTANYRLSMHYGKGTMVQSVIADEDTSLWMRQVFKILRQTQTIDVQLNKADGKILKVLQNGQQVENPLDDDLEILSAEETTITVPAGTFAATHIIAKSNDGDRLEVWSNPEDTVMDGTVKEIIGTDSGNIVLELRSFEHAG
jgi:hypothetical protein